MASSDMFLVLAQRTCGRMGNAESGAAKETAEWCDKEAKGGVGGEIVSGGGVRGHLLEWQVLSSIRRFCVSFSSFSWQGFQGDEWQCASAVSREVDSDGRSATFTLMTFNVWFAQHRQVSRAEELLRVVKREKPDAVCLQEATVRFLKVFLADDYIRQTYLASSNVEAFGELNEASGYDSFMLCRPWCAGELRRYRLVSKFARCFYINVCKQFAVGTIHLESLVDNARNRALQMEQIYSLLQELGVADKTFFCGDLNHCTSLGEDHLRPSSIDVWPLLRPKEEGWTEDPRVNHMLASKPGKVCFFFFPPFFSFCLMESSILRCGLTAS